MTVSTLYLHAFYVVTGIVLCAAITTPLALIAVWLCGTHPQFHEPCAMLIRLVLLVDFALSPLSGYGAHWLWQSFWEWCIPNLAAA